jgi:hypothetical protein
MTTLAVKMTSVLAPHLGPYSADAVTRHLYAKYRITESADRRRLYGLREFLRRVLAVYVGPAQAQRISGYCIPLRPSTSARPRRVATKISKGRRIRKRR